MVRRFHFSMTAFDIARLSYRVWLALNTQDLRLIRIFRIQTPDPPLVTLAEITSQSIAIHWETPSASKPVVEYLIRVNGVHGWCPYLWYLC
jgi:hypothetical protein